MASRSSIICCSSIFASRHCIISSISIL
jgi:hypothetical protein